MNRPRERKSAIGRVARFFGVSVAAVLGLAVALLVLSGAFVGWRLHALWQPSDYLPERPLIDYANESAMPGARPAETLFSWDGIVDPPVSARPWARWWWPGGDVEIAELQRELDDLKAQGFGGVEIQPFAPDRRVYEKDAEVRARVFSVDTPRYFDRLHGALTHAQSIGLQVDLTHYSGWPGASRAATLDDNERVLVWSHVRFRGGRSVNVQLPKPSPRKNALAMGLLGVASGYDMLDFAPQHARLTSVVAARVLSGRHSLLSFDDTLRLDGASVKALDAQVRDGRLVLDAPAGDWVAIASWTMPAGDTPVLSAIDPAGYVVDPFRADLVRAHYNYSFGARSGLPTLYGAPLRAVFNDSFEFKADRLGADDILAEFQRRRGYDLRPHLPAIYVEGTDNFYLSEVLPARAPDFRLGSDDARVRFDYNRTISDLLIERFVDGSRAWANARGLQSRGQSYGADIDVIRALGANDIPETEQLYAGGRTAFLRFASSAAMLYGRRLVSAESFVWAGQDYTANATRLKLAADLLFTAGVNQIVYHGYPYDWQRSVPAGDFGGVGWNPWSNPNVLAGLSFSGNYASEAVRADLPQLNRYIARAQNLLRQGEQRADVLIYYPFLGVRSGGYGGDFPETLADGRFALTDGGKVGGFGPSDAADERIVWLKSVQPLLQALADRGLTWSWVNGDALRNRLNPAGKISSGATYGSIVFANARAVDRSDLAAAVRLANAGTPVFAYGDPPSVQPGLHDHVAGDAQVRALGAQLTSLKGDAIAATDAIRSAVRPSLAFAAASGLRRYARILNGGASIDFLANPSNETVATTLFGDRFAGAWWFDAMTGEAAPVSTARDDKLSLSLRPYASRFLVRGVQMPGALRRTGGHSLLTASVERSWAIERWTMKSGDISRSGAMFDWRTDAALASSAREATYTASVEMPTLEPGASYLLRAGDVPGVASVKVNGVEAGGVSVAPNEVNITAALRPGANTIEIAYRPPLRNSLIVRADREAAFAHFRQRRDQRVPAGLLGPVEILELR